MIFSYVHVLTFKNILRTVRRKTFMLWPCVCGRHILYTSCCMSPGKDMDQGHTKCVKFSPKIKKNPDFFHLTQLRLNKAKDALLADCQQTLFNGIPLGFGEWAAFWQPVDSLQRGVNQLCVVLCAAKKSGTAGQQRQQSWADVPVHGQGSLCSAQRLLWDREQCM